MLALYSAFVLNTALQSLGLGGRIESTCSKSQIKKKSSLLLHSHVVTVTPWHIVLMKKNQKPTHLGLLYLLILLAVG